MAERHRAPDEADLDRALAELGSLVAYPATPDIAGAVRDRLLHQRTTPRGGVARRLVPVPPLRAAVAFAALVLLAIGLLALFPAARSAVADRLGLRGVSIRFLDEAPTPAPSPVGDDLLLGRRVDLDAAQHAVSFPIHVPTLDALDPPDEIYLSRGPSDGMVSFVYRAGPDLPSSPEIGVGALLTQFRGDTDLGLVQKGLFAKGLLTDTTLERLTVNGGPGYWIAGEAHSFLYRDPNDNVQEEQYRLAGNVLLWEQDGLTFRLESALPKEQALAIAESVRARK